MNFAREDAILILLLLVGAAYAVVSEKHSSTTIPVGDINGSMFIKENR